MKEWFRELQPMQLYIVLTLTIIFFIVELVISHFTHAITLLMDSYHTLCNIFALLTCMITVKYGLRNLQTQTANDPLDDKSTAVSTITETSTNCDTVNPSTNCLGTQESKLKNTFGWARIDVIGLLICCVFLASLSFSIVVEALQTLVHIGHHDEMHHTIPVLIVGVVGLILNVICYLLIGGYTFHQGSFLYMNEEGCVVLNRVVSNDSISRGEKRLSKTQTAPPSNYRQRQGAKEMLRDTIGCLFVIICAVMVHFTEENIAKYIDPLLSILSAIILMVLSFPYMKESCLILLQTIPDTINIESLRSELLEHFPDIINIHDLHIWQLTATKVISTAHIIFENPFVYSKITDKITEFFQEYGITQVTIQPEFFNRQHNNDSIEKVELCCLMHCQSEGCKTSHCCPDNIPKVLNTKSKPKSKEQNSTNVKVKVLFESDSSHTDTTLEEDQGNLELSR